MLAERGPYVVDADQLARDVVTPGSSGLAEVVDAFGAGVLRADGQLDRAALASVVFGDPRARAVLEAITHPRVEQRARELFAVAPAGAMLIYDVPLLAEGRGERSLRDQFAAVVVVDASDEKRLARLLARGLEARDAERRMSAQASREERLAIADYVIRNDGTLKELRAEVDQLWGLLTERLSGAGFTV
jgi:dephospho-CoA kinase